MTGSRKAVVYQLNKEELPELQIPDFVKKAVLLGLMAFFTHVTAELTKLAKED